MNEKLRDARATDATTAHQGVAGRTHVEWFLLAAVVTIASATALVLFLKYFDDPDALWRGVGSDRSIHLADGLNIAIAVKTLDFGWLLKLLRDSLKSFYPPLYAVTLSVVFLLGGLDVRLATVPGLLGWVATVVLTWLVARQMYLDRLLGRLSGAVAVSLAVASPSFRLLSNDVMLESCGAAFTALAVLLFMR